MSCPIRKVPKKREATEEEKILLNSMHKDLRRYRYFYYECKNIVLLEKNIPSDYEYDMLEKKYTAMCDEISVDPIRRIDNYVGFSLHIPMILIN